MKLLGLTGGIACGKSTVLSLFQDLGAVCLSADAVVHSLMSPGGDAYQDLIEHFGDDYLDDNKEIDRVKLGTLVFNDHTKKEELEGILHPLVKESFLKWKNENKVEDLLVYEIPLLFEKQREGDFDLIVCVSSSQETQIKRLKDRNSLNEEEAKLRLSSQMPLQTKIEKSDIVIENENKSLEQLKEEIRSKFF